MVPPSGDASAGPSEPKKVKRDGDADVVVVEEDEGEGEKVDQEDAPAEDEQGPLCTGCNRRCAEPLRCSQCTRQGHPRCLDLPEHMVDVVRTCVPPFFNDLAGGGGVEFACDSALCETYRSFDLPSPAET